MYTCHSDKFTKSIYVAKTAWMSYSDNNSELTYFLEQIAFSAYFVPRFKYNHAADMLCHTCLPRSNEPHPELEDVPPVHLYTKMTNWKLSRQQQILKRELSYTDDIYDLGSIPYCMQRIRRTYFLSSKVELIQHIRYEVFKQFQEHFKVIDTTDITVHSIKILA